MPLFSPVIQLHMSNCLSDISTWMAHHQLKLNMANTELLIFSIKHAFPWTLSISTNNLSLHPAQQAPKNLDSWRQPN